MRSVAYLSLIFTLLCVRLTFAEVHFPDLSSDEKRLNYLLTIQERIPTLFNHAVKYDIDLMELLGSQDKLQRLLLENPEYKKAFEEQHQKWPSIDIAPKSEQIVKSIQIDPKAVDAWKRSLNETLKLNHSPKEAIEKESQILKGRTSQGLETGLIMSLPQEIRKEVFSKVGDERYKLLEKHLPEKIGSDFKADQYGLPSTPKKDEALQLIKLIRSSETRLQQLIELQLVLQDEQGNSIKDGANKIAQLDANDLKYFTDPDAFKPRLQKIGIPITKDLTGNIQKHISSFANQVISTEEKIGKGIRLDEVPPAIGIFRGCTGGDCSSSLSFPYPNAPTERVFYIYDENNELKGYATGALVDVEDKKAFRIITIAGPRLSSADTELIFEGLNQIKDELKADMIMLPTFDQLNGLINYPPILEAYRKFSERKQSVAIKHLDPLHREAIEQFKSKNNHAPYDKMVNNQRGVIYKREHPLQLEIRIDHKILSSKNYTPLELKNASLELALNLLGSDRQTQVTRILTAAKIETKEQERIINLFNNVDNLSVLELKKQIMNSFLLSEEQYYARIKSFGRALLRSPDFDKFAEDPKYHPALVYKYINNLPGIDQIKSTTILQALIKHGDGNLLQIIGLSFFKLPLTPFAEKSLESFLKTVPPSTIQNWAPFAFNSGDPKNLRRIIDLLIERNNPKIDQSLVLQIASNEQFRPYAKELINLFIERGDDGVIEDICKLLFNSSTAFQYEEELNKLVRLKNSKATKGLAQHFFTNELKKETEYLLIELIKNSNEDDLQIIARDTFAQNYFHNQNKILALKDLIGRGDKEVNKILKAGLFNTSGPTYQGDLGHVPLIEALDIEDLKERKSFLERQIPSDGKLHYDKLIRESDPKVLSDWLSRAKIPTENASEIIKMLFEKNNPLIDQALIINVDRNKDMMPLVRPYLTPMIERGNDKVNIKISELLFNSSNGEEFEEEVFKMIKNRTENSTTSLAKTFFTRRFKKDNENLLIELIRNAENKDLPQIASTTFMQSNFHNQNKILALKILVERADENTIRELKKGVFNLRSNSYIGGAGHFPLLEALEISDLKRRKEFLDEKIPDAPPLDTRRAPKKIGLSLKMNDQIKNSAGEILTIESFVEDGRFGRVFKVKDSKGKIFALKVALNREQKTLKSIADDITKAEIYKKYQIPHAEIIEQGKNYLIKEWIEGTRADEWLNNWSKSGAPKKSEELLGLKSLIKSSAKSGAYVGDLTPKDLIWSNKKWIIVDSGAIKEGLTKDEAIEKYLERITKKFSKDATGKSCPTLFNSLLKN